MNESPDIGDDQHPNQSDRASSLEAFDKIELAMQLIDQAIKQRPILKDLQIEPLLRSLAEGMRILTAKDSELDLRALMLKHSWTVGQRFYVRVKVRDPSDCSFVLKPGQDIPEGVVIIGSMRHPPIAAGESVALDLEIVRSVGRVTWRIRAIDRE